jgi:hypothetical protein
MDFLASLFEPARILFTIPLGIALFFGLLALIGLVDFEALDFDLDLDTDVDLDADLDFDADVDLDADLDAGGDVGGAFDGEAGAPGTSVLALFGLGLIPLSLFITIWCVTFGWTGLALVEWLGPTVAALVGGGWATGLALAPVAFVLGVLVTAPTARLLSPLFEDYGRAKGASELVGKVAVLASGRLTSTFGRATVKLPSGVRADVAVRLDEHDAAAADTLGYGDDVLLYDYDAEQGVYLVAPAPDALRRDDRLPARRR